MAMTYEAYIDELTMLITEMYDVSEEAAIKQVIRAQAADGSGAEAAKANSTTTAADTSPDQHAQKVTANTRMQQKTPWTTV
ncbi:hypothetical protein RY831_21525 [Noviherbaspirillum sp. CPCC 100848]|uniref:Uncharacterized protein n=1 Tax=Noviherbaspirillum album TaxID=3080276 RepID=A0ABU6JE00_9BURK|nr:hypothetical protein [Noviherbaspirillum sp. CPCC 100848]MEC4721753.1 hypothetical protein [Noviherbaspirillum sp. CPCC 100848]